MAKYFYQNRPEVIPTQDGKYIGEHFGRLATGEQDFSLAHMVAPAGWSEPYQQPEFEEITLVLSGKKYVEFEDEFLIIHPGESVRVFAGTRVKYSNPFDEPCVYISLCIPAFSLENVNRT